MNRFVEAVPWHLDAVLEQFSQLTGRRYAAYDYQGPADAERVLVLMGSGCETAQETLEQCNRQGERAGLLRVRLFRPLVARLLVQALPASTRAIAVLDRCKDPGAAGEPLYLDVVTAIAEQWHAVHGVGCPPPRVVGGRFGLGSKEFTPAMVMAVLEHLQLSEPLNHFSVGIGDDVTHHSLPVDVTAGGEPALAPGEVRAIVYGLGSDGTVGANKATIKIIGEDTDLFVQGYFVIDSKKSGSVTVSHLRFGPRPIRSTYLIQHPTVVACHQWSFVERLDLLEGIVPGGVFLLNSPFDASETWARLPDVLCRRIREQELRVFVIHADRVAREAGLGPRLNTVMQACFFAISGVLPREQALTRIRSSIHTRYGAKGEAVVARNLAALEASIEQLMPLDWRLLDARPIAEASADTAGPARCASPSLAGRLAPVPSFVREVIGPMLERRGD